MGEVGLGYLAEYLFIIANYGCECFGTTIIFNTRQFLFPFKYWITNHSTILHFLALFNPTASAGFWDPPSITSLH
jgi:hypothetical protein